MTSINNGVKYRGCDFADDLLKPNIRNWLNKNNFKNTLNVPIRRKGMTGSGYKYQCHQNVFNLVNAYGGKRLGGYAVCIDDDADAVVDGAVAPLLLLVNASICDDDVLFVKRSLCLFLLCLPFNLLLFC